MDDPSLIGIHGLQRNGTFGSLNLVGNVLCQGLQSLFSALTVIFRIQFDSQITVCFLVYNKANKILKRIQGLTSLADQDSHISAL